MNKKTQKKYVALLTLLAMVICTMFCTNTVKADTNLPWDESEVVETSTCVVNGVERSLREYPKVCVNLQTGVRYNYSVWRFLLWQEEKVTHHRKQQCAK